MNFSYIKQDSRQFKTIKKSIFKKSNLSGSQKKRKKGKGILDISYIQFGFNR